MDGIESDKIIAFYIYNIFFVIYFDYNKYYNELLKNALKYGMSREQFWYGTNYKEYFIYEEAYFEKLHEQTHIQGYYNFIAFNCVLSNMFCDKKKGQKPMEYPQENMLHSIQDKTKNKTNVKKEITKQNFQQTYMNRLSNIW